ncbi:MAG: cystathionine gamma-synthase [Candidatus Aminicenantales bacterium]
MRFSTKAIHAGQPPDPLTGAVTVPIYPTSTFVQERPGRHKGYEYSRTSNPTRSALEQNLAALEDGKFGFAFASGCAAMDAVLQLCSPGDHIVAGNDLYGGTFRLFKEVFQPLGLKFTFVETHPPENIAPFLRKNTRMLWIESPSNPLLKITNLKKAAEVAHQENVILVADNTLATPYLQQPLSLGADVVVHSTTKYLSGHSDVIGGAVILNDEAMAEKVAFYQNAAGGIPGPFDCWLVLRGIKTLPVRMEKHFKNAQAIASYLERHPQVARVFYPGLPSHPQYQLAKLQMRNAGGMLSFEIRGNLETAQEFVSSTKIFSLAESLGGVESLIEHPASMTHASLKPEQMRESGLSDTLIRLSVGIEDIEDLMEDVEMAFKAINLN